MQKRKLNFFCFKTYKKNKFIVFYPIIFYDLLSSISDFTNRLFILFRIAYKTEFSSLVLVTDAICAMGFQVLSEKVPVFKKIYSLS